MNAPAEWIGERPTALQLGVILLVGVCGVMIAGLQPLLFTSTSSRFTTSKPMERSRS